MVFKSETETQISKYNDAVFSISRLHQMWLNCNAYIRRGNFVRWKFELDMIWLELSPDVKRQKEAESKRLIKTNKELMIKISKANTKNTIFFNLMNRHQFLREVQDIAGKAGVYRDENEEGFE